MDSMASKCRKFVPNIFNKTKCQNCFAAKEQHSAEALENNKASRKISKCGYLFVAPDYDFNNPLDKTRRWQRRFFRLYDDGELTFCVDENPDTVPQGSVDMNKCTDVKDAVGSTSHSNSMAIITPEKTIYVKGNSKEEIQWWERVFQPFALANEKPKKPGYNFTINTKMEDNGWDFSEESDNSDFSDNSDNKENIDTSNIHPNSTSDSTGDEIKTGRFEVEKVKSKDQPFSTYRGVRSMKHKTDKHYQEGLRKSSSLHDLSSEEKEPGNLDLASSKFLSRSGDRLNAASEGNVYPEAARLLTDFNANNPYTTFTRKTWQTLASGIPSPLKASNSHDATLNSTPSTSDVSTSGLSQRRGSLDDKTTATSKPRNAAERSRLHRERSASMKTFPSHFTLPKISSSIGAASVDRMLGHAARGQLSLDVGDGHGQQASGTSPGSQFVPRHQNETDEFKMAKSSELHVTSRSTPPPPSPTLVKSPASPSTKFEDLMYMKKGWLIKMGMSEKDWKKHWFVLTGNCLRYYKDAKAEESNNLDGRIDLSNCFEIAEVDIQRNYGFRIKTRNGEYVLSAMTSGIRSNWMKAIRLCMDLQSGVNNRTPSSMSVDSSSTTVSPRTIDDIDLDSSTSSRLSSSSASGGRPKEKKEYVKNIRRHYSDVNPGNIVGKLFSVKDLGSLGVPQSQVTAPASQSIVPSHSRSSSSSSSIHEPTVIERESKLEHKAPSSRPDSLESSTSSKSSKYSPGQDQYWSGGGLPFHRYVEGSDNQNSPENAVATSKAVSESKKEEEERKRRAKSPSARIKERSKIKVPKIHSPPPEKDDVMDYQGAVHAEVDRSSVASEEIDHQDLHDDHFGDSTDGRLSMGEDHLASTASSTGEVMLVDLLESEVESLKDRLDSTQQELVKMHEANRDLTSKLQTIVREKDASQLQASIDTNQGALSGTQAAGADNNSQEKEGALAEESRISACVQVNLLKRQLKESKDTNQRQKAEIDNLKSKLDMSVSKLTGTEKALSEALKDVKQEKDKFMKISNDLTKKIRNLEGQLKESNHKMDRHRENLMVKEKECRRFENEVKNLQQKNREHEREILKLKAVEQEYRQMKERYDDTERKLGCLKIELSEKDVQLKKMEGDCEHQMEELIQEFTKERDELENHYEDMKKQLLDAQRKTSYTDSLTNNMADALREKDEIIAQLEEKMIENERKLVDMTEELQAEGAENSEFQQRVESLQDEREDSERKVKELEKSVSHYQSQLTRMEKENASIRKQMDDLRKENSDMGDKLYSEKDPSELMRTNAELQGTVAELESEIELLHEKLLQADSDRREKLAASLEREDLSELLHTFILADAEVNDLNDSVLTLRKKFEDVLAHPQADQKKQLVSIAELIEDIGRKCDSVAEVIKQGSETSLDEDKKERDSGLDVSSSSEYKSLKEKHIKSEEEVKTMRQNIKDMEEKYSRLESEDNILRKRVKLLEEKYKVQIQGLGGKVDQLANKHKVKPEKKSSPVRKPVKPIDPTNAQEISEEIEGQLNELEDRIAVVEKVLMSQDLSVSSIDSRDFSESQTEDETEDSEAYTDSEEETDEESDEDTHDESTLTDTSDSSHLLVKLREMKSQLELTNTKLRDITMDISDQSLTSATGDSDGSGVEGELRKTLIKCGEKIDSLTNRLEEGVKRAKGDVPKFSDSTWAFQKCVQTLRDKVAEVNLMAIEHDELDSKDMKSMQEKLGSLLDYVDEVNHLGESDWDTMGKLAKQETKFQNLLARKEKATKKSSMKYEDKLQLYADRLAFEALLLGQMALLVQRQQYGAAYKDVLLKEIHEVNLQVLELERKVDTASRDLNQKESDEEKDLVSSYAAMLAEKIVLEGQLATCALSATGEQAGMDTTEVLSSLQVKDSPTVLAMEIFLRSQLDTSVSQQMQKFSENMDAFSNHIITRALLQGEVTYALKQVKRKFGTHNSQDIPSVVMTERRFAFDEMSARHKMILDVVNEFEPTAMTVLIQLIEISQGPGAPTVDFVCKQISDHVKAEIEVYKKQLQGADASNQVKIKHIMDHLQSEVDDVITIFREEYQCYVQTASPDIDPFVLKFSAENVAKDLAGVLIQKAVLEGTFAYVSDLHQKSPEVQSGQITAKADNEELLDLAQSLGQVLLTEANHKQSLAVEVRRQSSLQGSGSGGGDNITDLVGVIPDLESYPQSFNEYAATLVREAMFQAQLTYTTYKLKLQYHRELRDIKLKIEAGQKVELPSEIAREAESDIQATLTVFEEILDTKYEDECAVMGNLESEIKKLWTTPLEKSCASCKIMELQLKNLQKTFQHEVSVAQERQNVHLDVLRQEVHNVILHVEKYLEEHEKDRETLVADYEEKIAALQDEFDIMRIDHEEELEQVKQDIMTAVSAIKANEDTADTTLTQETKATGGVYDECRNLLEEIQQNLKSPDKSELMTKQIKAVMEKLESMDEHNTSQDSSTPMSPPPPQPQPVSPPVVEPEQTLLERTLSVDTDRTDGMDQVSGILEMSQHEQELEQLKREKEQALAEEIKTTKAALDAMKNAYEEELNREKDRYREALKTMCTDDYVTEIRRRHDAEIVKLSDELKQVQMHYQSKCEDYKLLEDRLDRTKIDYQTHINQLNTSNEQLTELVNTEIQQLKDFINSRTTGVISGSSTVEEELYDAQIMVRVKDAELQKLRSQVKNIENSLQRAIEEQRYQMTQYLTVVKQKQELEAKYKADIDELKHKKTPAQEAADARALRRTPSFHHRARSPSPESTVRSKDSSEHHSRDSYRRRSHISAKDLKRSKSSPTLPFVFDGKSVPGSSTAAATAANTKANRDSIGKYSKSPRGAKS